MSEGIGTWGYVAIAVAGAVVLCVPIVWALRRSRAQTGVLELADWGSPPTPTDLLMPGRPSSSFAGKLFGALS